MRPAFTVFVNEAPVREFRAALAIQRRQGPEGDELQYRTEEIVGIGRTAGNVHDCLVREYLGHPHGAGRIRSARWYCDDRRCALGRLQKVLLNRTIGDLAVDAAVLCGDGAVYDQQVVAEVFLHRCLASGLGLVPRGHAQRLVVVQGNQKASSRNTSSGLEVEIDRFLHGSFPRNVVRC